MVDKAVDRDRSPDTFGDDLGDVDDALALAETGFDPVANFDRGGRFGGLAIDLHVARPTCRCCVGAGFGQANRPQPLICTCCFDVHSLARAS